MAFKIFSRRGIYQPCLSVLGQPNLLKTLLHIEAKISLVPVPSPTARDGFLGLFGVAGHFFEILGQKPPRFVTDRVDASIPGSHRDEAFDEGFKLASLLAPDVRGFFLDLVGWVVCAHSSIDVQSVANLNRIEKGRRG